MHGAMQRKMQPKHSWLLQLHVAKTPNEKSRWWCPDKTPTQRKPRWMGHPQDLRFVCDQAREFSYMGHQRRLAALPARLNQKYLQVVPEPKANRRKRRTTNRNMSSFGNGGSCCSRTSVFGLQQESSVFGRRPEKLNYKGHEGTRRTRSGQQSAFSDQAARASDA